MIVQPHDICGKQVVITTETRLGEFVNVGVCLTASYGINKQDGKMYMSILLDCDGSVPTQFPVRDDDQDITEGWTITEIRNAPPTDTEGN